MAMVPHERSLVKRMADRPFIMLGVNADRSPDRLKRVQEEHHIPWRSWFDGRQGRTAAMYRIELFPTLYLIDHAGVIRKIFIGPPRGSDLDKDVEQLIEEAEEATAAKGTDPR